VLTSLPPLETDTLSRVTDLPGPLAEIRDDFLSFTENERLLGKTYAEHPELLERVEECQSPVYLAVDVVDGVVQVHATAPAEAPTTRGFASILVQGLSGLSAEDVLAIPDDFPMRLGLTSIVSPLRLNGMAGMLWRIKRHVSAKAAA
jgi:cysteine desulfuration protein SufE